jgi:hypothetical protein
MKAADNVGFWGNIDPKVKKGLVIGVSVLILGGGGYYFIRKRQKEGKARKILSKAVHSRTPESSVLKINTAIDGLGTDLEKIYEAYAEIPTRNGVDQVAKLYYQAYGETLDKALTGDIGSVEMQTIQNITSSKPEKKGMKPNYDLLSDWIFRLQKAAGYFNTDENAIYRVLWEVPDRNGIDVLSAAIQNDSELGKKSLVEFLESQLGSGDELDHAREIVARKNK